MKIHELLTPKQAKAWTKLRDKQTTEILYGGAAGGGKTFLGCLWIIVSCFKYPGSRWLIGRSKLKALKETTLATFFDVAAMLGLSADTDYNYNAQDSTIKIGGSTIVLKDLFQYPTDRNFDSLGSLEITGAFIDECNQITSKAKDIVGSRIRYKLEEFGLIPKLFMSCNPSKNWVYSEFYIPSTDGTIQSHRCFIQALVTDNPHIPRHYIEQLRRLPTDSQERLLNGNWRYDDDPSALIKHDSIVDLWRRDERGGDRYLTADIALHGSDRFVMGYWEGMDLHSVWVKQKSDAPTICSFIEEKESAYGVPRASIIFDADGLGAYLKGYLSGATPFNNGGKPHRPEYNKLKDDCYYKLAECVNMGVMSVQTDDFKDEIYQELEQVKSYHVDKDTKLRVLPKDKVKELLEGRSPDFADMMMMRMLPELRGKGKMVSRLIDKHKNAPRAGGFRLKR